MIEQKIEVEYSGGGVVNKRSGFRLVEWKSYSMESRKWSIHLSHFVEVDEAEMLKQHLDQRKDHAQRNERFSRYPNEKDETSRKFHQVLVSYQEFVQRRAGEEQAIALAMRIR